MKLIIDIPDHLYNVIKNKECTNKNVLTKAIENGTPLDKLREEVMEYIDDLDIAYEICGVFDNIGKAEREE